MISDIDEANFALIGPFDTKACAEAVDDKLYGCDIITTIHPYSVGMRWIGKAQKDRLETAQLIRNQTEESHEQYRQMLIGKLF